MNYLIDYLVECFTTPVALIGLLASAVVLISMCFNTSTRKGTIKMRTLNLVGSVISVVYGILLGSKGLGMIILNGPLVFINIYYLFRRNNYKEDSSLLADNSRNSMDETFDLTTAYSCPRCGTKNLHIIDSSITTGLDNLSIVQKHCKCLQCNAEVNVEFESKHSMLKHHDKTENNTIIKISFQPTIEAEMDDQNIEKDQEQIYDFEI